MRTGRKHLLPHTYFRGYYAIIGYAGSVIILSAFDLLWRGRHTALVYACNKILMYKRDMADTFYYKSFSPVKRKDGLMLMNVIRPIKQPIL